jgi:molecular chaperone DnaK
MTPTIGIDLGTTNSAVARVNEANHTEMIRSIEGDLMVPSVVLLEDERVYVGEEARLRGRGRPDRLVSCIKRNVGENVPAPPVDGVTLPTEVVQACILNKLRHDVSLQLGTGLGVVVAVPAFYGDPQRKAVADAGQMAGLNILDVVNEPVAAALAFSEYSGYLSPGITPLRKMYLLVYDLGGFSFEVTLLEVESGGLITLGTDHDLHLGGHDWDFRVADYVAEQFLNHHGLDPRKDPAGLELLLHRAERAKRALGLRRSVNVTMEFAGRSTTIDLSREKFIELTSDLMQRTADMARRLLQQSGLGWSDVSRVLLVGGATRMPLIRQMLMQLTGQQPDTTVNPEEAVARGAAIYAHQVQAMAAATGQHPRFRVTNVTTHSLGIEGVDQKTGRKTNTVLIPRGASLPAKVTRKFVTKANAQKSITIVVLEGDEADPDACTRIGRATIRDLPSELSQEWPVDVTYEYSAGGRLKVDAQVRYTDRVVHLELLRTSGLSFDQIRTWRQLVVQGAGWQAMRAVLERERHPPIAVASSAGDETEPELPPARLSALASRYASYVLRFLGVPRGGDSPEEQAPSDASPAPSKKAPSAPESQ